MKTFIYRILFFILPILLIAILGEVLLRRMPNDYKLKNAYLEKNSDSIETLVLGSSHAFYGINPAYFKSKCFSACQVSQTLNYDLAILMKFNPKWSGLKTIIVPISYSSLFAKLETGEEYWRAKNYVLYYHMNTSDALKDHSEILSNKLGVNFKRIASNYILGKNPITCSELGWGDAYHSTNGVDLVETGRTHAERHTKRNYNLLPENVAILKSMIAFCDKNNVQLLLVTLPAYQTYRKDLNKIQLDLTVKTCIGLARDNKHCSYMNLLEDSSFKAVDYYDADHLNEIGSKKLSLILSESI